MPEPKSGDTLGDFICRSPRSAKIARCARWSDCDFRRSPRSAYKIADIWHVRYRRLNSPAFFKCARSRDFLRLLLGQSPVKSTHQIGRFYHMNFQTDYHIAAIGEKNRKRWRSNSPRSAYKIAMCVAGLRSAARFSRISEPDTMKAINVGPIWCTVGMSSSSSLNSVASIIGEFWMGWQSRQWMVNSPIRHIEALHFDLRFI